MSDRHLIIFDMDLTLIQTREIHIQGMRSCFQACLGITPDLSSFDELAGKPLDELLSIVYRETLTVASDPPESLLTQLRKTFAAFYRDHLSDLVKPFPGIPEMLTLLQERPYHLALASSKKRSIGERELDSTRLTPFFPITVFRDDVFSPKPSPDAIFRVLQLAGWPRDDLAQLKRVTMVGDAAEDILCAHNAGVRSVHAIWKWERPAPSGLLPQGISADYTAQSPSDLLTFLLDLLPSVQRRDRSRSAFPPSMLQ